jgi:hypothetical protein
VALLLIALWLLGTWGPDNNEPNRLATATPTATATATPAKKSKKKKKAAPTRVTLRLTATSRVYVCAEDATGKQVVRGDILEPGKSTRTFRSRRFRVNLGSGAVRMTVSGKRYKAADIGRPIGYEIRPGRKPVRLKESVRLKLCAT